VNHQSVFGLTPREL
jgi:DNA-binding CsgD family transcriptional regulator